jgi:hypothetical protein
VRPALFLQFIVFQILSRMPFTISNTMGQKRAKPSQELEVD